MTSDGLVTLPLYKFSYVTTASLQGKLVWTHLPQRDNIFAVFDHVISKDHGGLLIKKELLKIIRGGEVLEQLDTQDLTIQARADQERARSQSMTDSNRLVIIIVKKPLIAVRYQLPDGQFRRMQMNFALDSGYDVAFNFLSRLGLPIRDKNKVTVPQQQLLSISQQYGDGMSRDLPRLAGPVNPASLSFIQDGSAARPQRGFHHHALDLQHPNQEHYYPVAGRPADRSNIAERSSSTVIQSDAIADRRGPLHYSLSRSPAYPYLSEPLRSRPETRPSTKKELESNSARGPQYLHELHDAVRRVLFDKSNGEEKRPSTAPVNLSSDTLSQMLPPKRALPFPEIRPKASERNMEFEVTKSTPKVTSQLQPPVAKKKKSPKQRTTAKPKRPTPRPATNRNKSDITLQKPSKSVNPLEDAVASAALPQAPESIRGLSQVGAKTVAMDESGANGVRSSATKKSLPVQHLEESVDEEWMARVDSFVKEYQNHVVPAAAPKEVPPNDLAVYAALPEKERLAAIDTMITEYIMDENFVTLCQDVEKSWKRVALGF